VKGIERGEKGSQRSKAARWNVGEKRTRRCRMRKQAGKNRVSKNGKTDLPRKGTSTPF